MSHTDAKHVNNSREKDIYWQTTGWRTTMLIISPEASPDFGQAGAQPDAGNYSVSLVNAQYVSTNEP